MARRTEIMGFSLDHKSIRDSITALSKYMNDPAPNLAQLVDTAYLALANKDEDVAAYLRACDLTIVQDTAILEEVKVTSAQRLSDAADAKFFGEFMKRAIRDRRTLYLLAENAEKLEEFLNYLKENHPDLAVVGSYNLDEADPDGETVVNDINEKMPHIVLSFLPSPMQEQFFLNHQDKIFTYLWIGLGDSLPNKKKNQGILGWFHKRMSKKVIKAPQTSDFHQWLL